MPRGIGGIRGMDVEQIHKEDNAVEIRKLAAHAGNFASSYL